VSPFLAFVGVSVAGTWGLAAIGMVASGIILLVAPGDHETASGSTLPGIVLLVCGIVNLGLMQVVITPLLGLDPPIPVSKRSIIPANRLTRWVRTGLQVRDLPDGFPKEIRLKGQRILLVRRGERVDALTALCSHARLPLGGFPGSPIKAEPIRDDCVMCPFHGARFEVETGVPGRHAEQAFPRAVRAAGAEAGAEAEHERRGHPDLPGARRERRSSRGAQRAQVAKGRTGYNRFAATSVARATKRCPT
jgi:nitrite reductase/ring-hydroxylating ferredoxin subunit